MRQERFRICLLREFYAGLDQRLYTVLALIQILTIQVCARRELWLVLALIFLALALVLIGFIPDSQKKLHSTNDLSGDSDRKRHKRQLLLAIFISLSTATSIYIRLYRPAVYADVLLNEADASIHDIKVLACRDTVFGAYELTALVDKSVRAQFSFTHSAKPVYGDRFKARLCFYPTSRAANPGAFDERSYRLSQGIFLNAAMAEGETPHDIKGPLWRDLPAKMANHINQYVSRYFVSVFGEDSGALAAAMLLGNEDLLGRSIKDDFKQSGLSHLLVVSGSNVSLLFTFIVPFLQRSPLSWKRRQLTYLPALLFFGMLINWDASVTRAIAMNLVVIIARVLYRPVSGRSALGLAVCMILAFNPRSALQTGFLMSSAVSYALMTILSPLSERMLDISIHSFGVKKQWLLLERRKKNRIRILMVAMLTPLVSQFAVIPFSLSIGSAFTFWSIPLNWAAVPISAALTIMLTVITPLALLAPYLDYRLLASIFKPIEVLLLLMRKLASLPGVFHARSVMPNQRFIYLYILIIILLICFIQAKPIRSACRITTAYLLAAGIILISAYVIKPDLEIYFLSVGQADSAIIKAKSGQTILIDTASRKEGERVILPAIRKLGITRIDLAIVTHMHDDHAGSLDFLMKEGMIRSVAATPQVYGSTKDACDERELDARLRQIATELKIPWTEITAGDIVNIGRTFRLKCIWPETAAKSGNAASLVFHLTGQNLDVLMTGDCEKEAELAMIGQNTIADIDILKVAHHGSETSCCKLFLECCRPEISVISVGRNNYGHPHEAVLQSLQDIGSEVFRTDEDGALVLQSRNQSWTFYRYNCPKIIWKGK